MQFRDLKAQYQALKPQMDEAILKVMEEGVFISGAPVRELEERLAAYVGVKHCITCGNGTDALTLALTANNIGPGDAVFLPDFTFFASGEAPASLGAAVVFVDVEPDTFNISPAGLEAAIRRVKREGRLRPRAVIPVDLFGLPADHPALRAIADRHGLLIAEDGAQGFGGTINGRRACSFGDIAITSFFPAKPLGCCGDGGAVFTNDDGQAALIRSLGVHGKGENKYDNVRLGRNSRLDTIQAAILHVKLDVFEEELAAVDRAARWYDRRLAEAVKTPVIPEGYTSSRAQYTIQLADKQQRDAVRAALQQQGIPTMIYYAKPLHEQAAFAHMPYNGECPVSEELCHRALSLPLHPYLDEAGVSYICRSLLAALQPQKQPEKRGVLS